jgi:hypothetical protein
MAELLDALLGLLHLVYELPKLVSLVQELRSNPEITVALSILLLAGVVAYAIIRYTRRNRSDFLTLR